MENQEQVPLLNEQYSRINDALSRMMSILPEIIDYVAGLSGFKSKFPEAASTYAAAKEEIAETETEAETLAQDDWFNRLGEDVAAGDKVSHLGVAYEVIQPHTLTACWVPGEVPALYKKSADPGEEWPEWEQPTGAHDAYAKDSKVSHNGKHWTSDIDNNVWEPGVYGWSVSN